MASLYLPKWTQLSTDAGAPLNGGKLSFSLTTTTTAKNTYPTEADAIAGTNANVNPVILDADGRSPMEVWISGRYRLRTYTSAGVLIADDDPIEDGVSASTAQNQAQGWGGNNSGTANALVFTYAPAITSYTNGTPLRGRITADNSGAVTINAGAGVKSLVKRDGGALVSGDLQGPDIIEFSYDSTTDVFRLLSANTAFSVTGGTLTGAINEAHGPDVASAGTINLTTATGNLIDVTGTTTITAITLADGASRTVRFTGILTLTNGASLVLPGAANITTAAGDFAIFRGYAAGVVRCVAYTVAAARVGGSLLQSGGNIVSPTDTSEDTLGTINVPANALGANGAVRLQVMFTCVNNANVKTIRVRYSGGAGTIVLTFFLTSVAAFTTTLTIANKNATNAQVSAQDGSATVTATSVDTTAATSIVITSQKATAGDNLTLVHYQSEILPSA